MQRKMGLIIKNKYLILGTFLFLLFTLFVFPNKAFAATYYFNNAVDQSPTEQGNYWDDAGFSTQSSSLPDFGVDEVFVTSGVTFDNDGLDDIIFNGSATNDGTVTGNAIFNSSSQNSASGIVDGNATFNGDLTENTGTVTGTKTRTYTSNVTTTRNFTNWTVVADGAVVNVTGATYTNTTIFTKINGGSFVGQTYYFINAIDTSPAELGNYCLVFDKGNCPTPATVLPNFSIDLLNIGENIIFNGNAIFNGNVINEGTVTGNAIFNDTSHNEGTVTGDVTFNTTYYDSLPSGGSFTLDGNIVWKGTIGGIIYGSDNQTITEYIFKGLAHNNGAIVGNATFYINATNNGTVTGTKTRYYDFATEDSKDFVTTGPWTVVADGFEVDISGGVFDNTTTFNTVNGGSFIYGVSLASSYYNNGAVTLIYSAALDTGSVPDVSDFVVTVNGEIIPVSSVSIDARKVILTLSQNLELYASDVVSVDYTVGSNPIQRNDTLISSFSNLDVKVAIPFNGSTSVYPFTVGAKVYITNSNQSDNTLVMNVIDSATDTVINTISIPNTGEDFLASSGYFLYDLGGAVIDTRTDTLVTNLTYGLGPFSFALVGTKLYVSNFNGNTVSVVDTLTNTVIATIPAQNNPYYFSIVGTKLYVNNYGSSSMLVIDTTTDTAQIISVVNAPRYSFAAGDKIYVMHDSVGLGVSVIDTNTDTVINTISMNSPTYATLVGNKLYISDSGGFVYVVDINTDTIIDTIIVGNNPYYSSFFKDRLYVSNITDSTVSVINTNTNTVVDTISVSGLPKYLNIAGSKLYVGNQSVSFIYAMSVISTSTIPSQLPNLVSFTSTTSSGTYTPGESINITANFGRSLQAGSTMTVGLNTGETVVLNNVSGTTLTGTYVISIGAETPDLAVTAIISSNVTDSTGTYNRTSHDLPSSQGSFTAENSFITRNIGDSKNIKIGSYESITTGSNPYQISVPINGYLYVANQGAGTVSVIRISDNTLTDTITVGDEPYGLTYSNSQLYVANTGSDTVSVIDPSTNTVTDTISVGVKPYYVEKIGNTVYVTNGASNTVSVINTTSNTVTDTISVGSYPRGIKAHGTDLYVANYGDPNYSGGNYISVIDSLTNEVTDTIILPGGSDGPRGVTVLDSKVYVTNFRSNNVSVINTATNTITDTIEVDTGPRGIIGLGTNIYVENFDDGTISVIDTNSNTITNTITVGHSPAGMSISGTDIYLTSFQDNKVYILDTLTNTLQDETTTPDPDPTPTPNVSGSSKRFFLQPTTPISVITPPVVSTGTILTKTLKLKMTDLEVKKLQIFLNAQGFILAKSGAGSPGKETNKFGVLTLNAVKKFQKKYGLKVDGIVGVKTREVVEGVR